MFEYSETKYAARQHVKQNNSRCRYVNRISFLSLFLRQWSNQKKSNIPVQYNDINLEIRTHLAHHLQNKRDFYRCIIELRNTADVRKIEAITTANGNALQIIRVLAVKQDKMGVSFYSMAYGYLSEDSISLQDLLIFFENPFSLNFGALACDF